MPKSKKLRPSSTAGRTKGSNCQRSQGKNLYCKDTILYRKNPDLYAKCCIEIDNQKGNRQSTSN